MVARGEPIRYHLMREPKNLFVPPPSLPSSTFCKFGLTFKFFGKKKKHEFINGGEKNPQKTHTKPYIGREEHFIWRLTKRQYKNI